MKLNYKIDNSGDIEFYKDKELIASFDIKENELDIAPIYLEFAEVEFIYNVLKEKL